MIGRLSTLLALLCAFLAAQPAAAEWLRAESPNFILYGQGEEARLRQRVAELEDFHRLLRQLTGTTDSGPSPKLSIHLVRGIGGIRAILPGASGIEGFYTASPEGILGVVNDSADRAYFGRNEVLFHEYAHHFMLQHFPAVYPQWYIEGFAEYVATARFDGETIEFGRFNEARASWLADRSGWLPLNHMLFGDPGQLTARQQIQLYSQSWLLVHYLLRDSERMRQLNRYLATVSGGEDGPAAFQRNFGINASQMQRRISEYAGSSISFTRIRRASASSPPAITVTRLPASADDLLPLQAAMRTGSRIDGASAVRRARRAAGAAPDPFAARILAEAEALYGDGAAAERLITPLLQASPRDAELLYLMAMRHLVAGRADAAGRAQHYRAARNWFARAHQADENHYPTLYHYAEALSADNAALLSDNTINILILAQQIAPQVDEIRLSAANLMLRRGQWAEAEALLLPLASHSHGGQRTALARTLLAKARARDSNGLPGMFPGPTDD